MKKLLLILLALFTVSSLASAKTEKNQDNLLRTVYNAYDLQRNTVSNVDFFTTNYGIFGLDIAHNKGGLLWPRGSNNEYIFAGGFWFGAKKFIPDSNGYRNLVALSYNPNNGNSWFVPGAIEDGDTVNQSLKEKTKCYFSTDFNKETGEPLDNSGPNWCLWKNDSLYRYQYGTVRHQFENNLAKRNRADYPLGPMFVSDEDIVTVSKDTQLDRYDGGQSIRAGEGFPLRCQYETRIYTWGSGDMKDVVIISYLIQNKSTDTLHDCWFAPVYDADIALFTNSQNGATNDRFSYFADDSSQNLAYGWTETNQGELGNGFGYLGVSLLETPAVDANRFIRKDKLIFEQSEQLGLQTFRNWPIQLDANSNFTRYSLMTSRLKDGDNGPNDYRILLATGPFNLLPGEVARVAVALVFAMPAKGGEADGTYEDMTGLKRTAEKGAKSELLAKNSSLLGKLNQARENYYSVLPLSVKCSSNLNTLNGIEIYPNPAEDFIEISVGSRHGLPNPDIRIFNVFGETVKNPTPTLPEGEGLRIDVSGLPSGLYFVKVGDKVKKFVKI